ncbi:MAG: hypothetical protein RL021_2051 [Bacteroidota bacterium]|jgi:uncharacterized protein (TIGR03437 family)
MRNLVALLLLSAPSFLLSCNKSDADSDNQNGTAPSIYSFSPTSGGAGTLVSVYGANFNAATGVSFNGTASDFTLVSPTQITCTLPDSATTGKVSVVTPQGTAYSSADFIVTTLSVEYSISCADCFVYCTGNNGQVNNFFHQNSSWKYTYEAQPGDTLRLVAQNTSGQPASVAGYIRLNGSVVAADTSYCPINGVIVVSDTL